MSESQWSTSTFTTVRDSEAERRWFIQQYVMARAAVVQTFVPMFAADEAAAVWDKYMKPKEEEK